MTFRFHGVTMASASQSSRSPSMVVTSMTRRRLRHRPIEVQGGQDPQTVRGEWFIDHLDGRRLPGLLPGNSTGVEDEVDRVYRPRARRSGLPTESRVRLIAV